MLASLMSVATVILIKINRYMVFAKPNPWRLSLMLSGCQIFPPKVSLEPAPSLTPPRISCHHRVLPIASTPSFQTTVKPLYALPSSPTRAGDAGVVLKPATPFPSMQQHYPPQAHDVVPQRYQPVLSLGPQHRHPP
jgi:hypothetical protein